MLEGAQEMRAVLGGTLSRHEVDVNESVAQV